MKKNRSSYNLSIMALVCLPLLSGCVTGKDFRGLQLHVRSMDNRLVELEAEVEELRVGAGTSVELMQKQQAGMGNTLERMNTDFLQVKGQLDESRHRYRSLQSENERLKSKLAELQNITEMRTSELQQRLGTVESSTTEIDSRLTTVHSNLTDLQKAQAKAAAAKAEAAAKAADEARKKALEMKKSSSGSGVHEIVPEKTKKTSSDVAPQTSSDAVSAPEASPNVFEKEEKETGKSLYDEAMGQYNAKNYKKSQELFRQFIDTFPNDKLSVNARFWIGDCLFNQSDYALAILEYQNVIADYPNHSKAPAALYKQGMAFEKLQDTDTAVIVYKKILGEYPKSDQAGLAKSRIQTLGK